MAGHSWDPLARRTLQDDNVREGRGVRKGRYVSYVVHTILLLCLGVSVRPAAGCQNLSQALRKLGPYVCVETSVHVPLSTLFSAVGCLATGMTCSGRSIATFSLFVSGSSADMCLRGSRTRLSSTTAPNSSRAECQ